MMTILPLADTDGWNMHGAGAGWMAVMMIGMALFWGAVILGCVWLVRDGTGRWQRRPQETALTVLDRRFAEGALSVDEYHQRTDVLTGAAVLRPGQSISAHGNERRER